MNYYLCPVQNKTITMKKFYPLNETLTIDYPADILLPFKVDERIFLLQHIEEYLLPYEFSIVSINRASRNLVLRVTAIYQNGLPFAALSILLPEHMLRIYVQLTNHHVAGITSLMNVLPVDYQTEQVKPDSSEPSAVSLDKLNNTLCTMSDQFASMENLMQKFSADKFSRAATLDKQFDDIMQLMKEFLASQKGPSINDTLDDTDLEHSDNGRIEVVEPEEEEIFEESEVLDCVKDYIRKRGYYFSDETLYNYHICLKTRPFVILAGLSGTGKSKLAQLYAEALGQDSNFKRLPVRPNWNDDRYLLGHLNFVTGEYVAEPAVEFILRAIADQRHFYSLCLDEMNLAHVEYYFSQFLSAMEGDSPKDRRISLMSQQAFDQLQHQYRGQHKKAKLLPAELSLPDNLVFTGTINVDETAQPISDKVIDRANIIEFFNVDLDNIPKPGDAGEPLLITNGAWQSYRATEPNTDYHSQLIEIDKLLKQADMGLGYRVVHEIELYLANSKGLLDPLTAFDLQCKQRILPRIHGTEFIDGTLGDLVAFSKRYKLGRTEKRLQEMKNRLKRDGYTNFWR